MKPYSFKLSVLSLLAAVTPSDARSDNALTNLIGSVPYYNLEQRNVPDEFKDFMVHETNGEDFIYSEGLPQSNRYTSRRTANGDIVVEDGDGDTQIAHDGDIIADNRGHKKKKGGRRGHRNDEPPARKRMHFDTDHMMDTGVHDDVHYYDMRTMTHSRPEKKKSHKSRSNRRRRRNYEWSDWESDSNSEYGSESDWEDDYYHTPADDHYYDEEEDFYQHSYRAAKKAR